MDRLLGLVFSALFISSMTYPVQAAIFSGNLVQDDAVALFNFTVTAEGYYDIRSYGYAGGMLSNNSIVNGGGFDSYITVFNSAGLFQSENDDGMGVNIDPNTLVGFDARLSEFFIPDTYTIAVSQFENPANGPLLSDGFFRQGEGNYTPTFDPACLALSFCDVSGFSPYNERTSAWLVEVTPTIVPLPAALPLFVSGLVGLGVLYRRRIVA